MDKYKFDALSAYLSMKNNSIERFMRKHFDEGYLQEVEEPVRKYVEFINGVNVPSAQAKRTVPRRSRTENKVRTNREERKDNNDDSANKP